jgi:MFS family permease
LTQEQLSLLLPGASAIALDTVPTTDIEQPGMGKALGAVTSGATGLSGGVLGAAVAGLFLPGVGSLVVLGAAALGGVIGAIAGAGVGDTLEESLTTGLPWDEVFVYEDALRQGRSIVVALAHDEKQARIVKDVFIHADMESIDAAHELVSIWVYSF